MSKCFTWFPIGGLGEHNIYQNLVWITMCVLFLLGGCLTVKNLWGLLTGEDGAKFAGGIAASSFAGYLTSWLCEFLVNCIFQLMRDCSLSNAHLSR